MLSTCLRVAFGISQGVMNFGRGQKSLTFSNFAHTETVNPTVDDDLSMSMPNPKSCGIWLFLFGMFDDVSNPEYIAGSTEVNDTYGTEHVNTGVCAGFHVNEGNA